MTRERYDVCVVGSGAGGGIAAYVLALAGARVLVLEKGPWLTAEDFGDDELRFGERNFIFQDPIVEPRTFRNRPEEGNHQYVGRVLGCSQCVGGGSVHYGAVSFRFRPEDFGALETWGIVPGADLVNWPLDYEDLLPYYRFVEQLIGIAGGQLADDPNPGRPVPDAEWRTDPYQMPGHPPAYGAKLFEEAASALGLHPFPTPVAINNGEYDGRPGCTYCGFCSSHGCPIDAKSDTRVTALEKALATGRLEIRAECNAARVVVRKGRADHVEYFDPNGRTRSVAADVIILAAGTVDTPRLALLSELPRDLVNHDVLGRYLMVHHFPGGIGFFDERIDYYRGFWSMRCLDDFYVGDPTSGEPIFGLGNIQTVGPSSGYPFFAGGIIATAKTVGWGSGHKELMRRIFGHVQFLGMVGQDPPVRTNAVDLDPTVKDIWGMPAARITYAHHPQDYVAAAFAAPRISEILTAMGATSTQSVLPFAATTSIPQPGPKDGHRRGIGRQSPNPIGGLVNHQMGTMRMGADPDSSVVDAGGRFWGIPNLYACDASIFPTSGGYNPTLTIQALAWRIARGISLSA